jgi:spoIIIJ-associated protein
VDWVKTTAKTVPEAIEQALDNLGVDESEAEIVVLEEPRPGLFGRMRGTARVQARIKPKPIRPKMERNRKRRGGDNRNRDRDRKRGRGSGGGGRGRNDGGGSGGRDRSGDAAAVATEAGPRNGQDGGPDSDRSEGSRASGDSGNRRRPRKRKRSGGGRSGGESAAANGSGDDSPRSGADGESRTASQEPEQGASVEEVAVHLRTFLTDLNDAFGFDSDVSIDDSEEGTLIGRFEGRHGLLVGPKGRTLDAIQELARISCQRTVPSTVRIKVDVADYRAQRAEKLAGFAQSAADKAAGDGVEVALEPMSPADRKIIHDALNGDDRVETRSVGTEPRRKVLVVPLVDADADLDDDDTDEDDAVDETTE